ncbi:hypothetical protein TIFTF001_024345 [Ficus carica]|uniref:SMAX1-like nucleotide binding domain-containing protein n=1 Tax=Ficus carica TaxID=3494 RepID=A0AA88ALY6_FICCA|nr:hypothetical protein TIFTF001_024345 [Ficus carica]
MRSGVITSGVEQTLTAEAAAVLKHSLSLARRRGHAHLTPLHVAATLLSSGSSSSCNSRSSLFRRACLNSYSSLPHTPPPPPSTGGIFSSPCSPDHTPPTFSFHHNHPPHFLFSPPKHHNIKVPYCHYPNNKNNNNNNNNYNIVSSTCSNYVVKEEDVKLVFEVLLTNNIDNNNNNNIANANVKKRNIVIVGDSAGVSEGIVMEVMRRFERGEVPHQGLRKTKFKDKNKKEVRIMGSANYQTYMRCQMREPPLEMQWSLHAVSLPACSPALALTLHNNPPPPPPPPPPPHHFSSFHESRRLMSSQEQLGKETKPFFISKEEKMLQPNNNNNNSKSKLQSLCRECSSNFDKEAHQLVLRSSSAAPHNKLPAWLQPHPPQPPHLDELVELKKKWSRLCHSLHQARHNITTESQSSFPYPLWPNQSSNNNNNNINNIFQDSNSISFVDDHPAPRPGSNIPRFRRQQSCVIEFNFDGQVARKHDDHEQPSEIGDEEKITLALGNSNIINCVSLDHHEFGKVERGEMCRVLKENVPWQSEITPSIADAIVTSQSRVITWLLLHGNDLIGKRRLACAVAESVLGSADMLLQLNRQGITGNAAERSQDSAIGLITKALKSHKKIVVLVDDIDSVDTQLMKFLCDGFESGKFGGGGGGEVTRTDHADFGRAIFILTKEGEIAGYGTDVKNKESVVIQMTLHISETKSTRDTNSNFEVLNLDHKRKAVVANWEPTKKSKNPRTGTEKGFGDIVGLDLNVMAKDDQEEDEENNSNEENKQGELSPISSDLTRETENVSNPSAFIECIENVFAFERSPAREREMAEHLLGKMEKCFEEIIGGDENMFRFRVEGRVLEEVCKGCGNFTNRVFEKWGKEVLEKALMKMVIRFSSNGKEKKGGVVNVRLCLGGGNLEQGLILEDGFMGSCLPNKIQLFNKD